MKSICITLTSPFVLNAFLLGHISRLAREMSVTVCLNTEESDIPVLLPSEVELISVEIRRAISPYHDVLAWWKLRKIYAERKFTAVFTVTPKGGLLGMAAALTAHVPLRVHCFTGQVWANKRGFGRWVLKTIERMIALCATDLLADSPSQKDFLVSEGIMGANAILVLGSGSISGVDTDKFKPDDNVRQQVREEIETDPDCICLLYAGRMKREKGVLDLLAAFTSLREAYSDLRLILVGPDEDNLLEKIDKRGIIVVGYSKQVERYMAAADIFVLPSYREGFGSVLIEAAATGLPSIASRIYGITDAVHEGVTGLLHAPGNVHEIKKCITHLVEDSQFREQLGQSGRKRVLQHFTSEKLEKHLSSFLKSRIAAIK